MNIQNYKKIYFIGIGGIGMSALARWFNADDCLVAGYDKTESTLTNSLIDEGIAVIYSEAVSEIPASFINDKDNTLVIYTPAVPNTHQGYNYFKDNGFTIIKRSTALGLLVKEHKGIGIAGTHGKTSTSTTVAWLMQNRCSAFLGGISKNLENNVIINPKAEYVVIEADEFDRSFLTLHPQIALVSSMDADHLDIYENHAAVIQAFHEFIAQIKPQGSLVYKQGLKISKEKNTQIQYYTYALDTIEADFYASNIKIVDGYYHFDWNTPDGVFNNFVLGVPGLYNLENAVGAMACAYLAKTPIVDLRANLANYQGVQRRFDHHIRTAEVILIDDYAHHPEEIRACIHSIRHMYPNKPILGIFQPHLFSRTRDFVDEFAQSLSLCDSVILTDIYPAREAPIPGINSQIILDKIAIKSKLLCAYNQVVDEALKINTAIIVVMGAGNIDRLVPELASKIKRKFNIEP